MSAALLPTLLLIAGAFIGDDDPAERGRVFYREGKTVSGRKVDALVGNPPTAVPAAVMPCVNCHGQKGHGRPEGGVLPSNITWDVLTRPYGLVTETGRRRPPYDAQLLIRAITQGLDSAGNTLDPNMPRYTLTDNEANDLAAWLEVMEQTKDPGITDTAIHIGILGLGTGPANQDAAATWRAFNQQLQSAGGIFGRNLDLRPLQLTGDPSADTAALKAFHAKAQPFLLITLGDAAVPSHIADFAHQQEIPLIGARTLAPPRLQREAFYLFPGEGAHGQALARFAEKKMGQGIAVVLTQPSFKKAANAIVDACVADGWLTPPQVFLLDPTRGDTGGKIRQITALRPKYIFNMGLFNQEITQLAAAFTKVGHKTTVLSPGTMATQAWYQPNTAWSNLFLTSGIQNDDLRGGVPLYQQLMRTHQLPKRPTNAHLTSLATAILLQDVLLACGRALSREALLTALESRHRFQTGFAPPITYGPNRRVGIETIYLHRYDFEKKQTQLISALP